MDKHKSYWFKRRRYGYGWTPVTWQGWVVILIFLALVFAGLGIYQIEGYTETELTFFYLIWVGILLIILILINKVKGPDPKWRWGKDAGDDPEKDW